MAEVQVSVEAPPPATAVGLAVNFTVGAGITVMAAEAILLWPPAPVQISEYEAPAVTGTVIWLPLGGLAPLQAPEAVQELALVELQVNVEVPPSATAVGFAASVTVGAGITVTVAVATLLPPPAPVQVNEYDVVAERAAVTCVPPVALAPLQPPEALQDVASVELQVNVEVPPLPSVVGAALMEAVGCGGALGLGETPPPPQATSSSAAMRGRLRLKGRRSGATSINRLHRRSALERLVLRHIKVKSTLNPEF